MEKLRDSKVAKGAKTGSNVEVKKMEVHATCIIWELLDSKGNVRYQEKVPTNEPLTVKRKSSYVWNWTADVEPGIYTVKICQPVEEERNLDKKLHVLPNKYMPYQFCIKGEKDKPFVIDTKFTNKLMLLLYVEPSFGIQTTATVKVSVDKENWIPTDKIEQYPLCSSTQCYSKLYNENSLGTELPVNPISFPYIQVKIPLIDSKNITMFYSLGEIEGPLTSPPPESKKDSNCMHHTE